MSHPNGIAHWDDPYLLFCFLLFRYFGRSTEGVPSR